jgi:hypothetical protein
MCDTSAKDATREIKSKSRVVEYIMKRAENVRKEMEENNFLSETFITGVNGYCMFLRCLN